MAAEQQQGLVPHPSVAVWAILKLGYAQVGWQLWAQKDTKGNLHCWKSLELISATLGQRYGRPGFGISNSAF